MRFALLGDHPDGLDFAGAAADSGRHQVVACSAGLDERTVRRLGGPRLVGDVEEILADPAVEAVIVAGRPSVRAAQLRRALQSERHVLCVHPADEKPDAAYEAGMIRDDVKVVLFPLLPEALHPAVRRLGEFVDRERGESVAGKFRALLVERCSPGEVLDNVHEPGLEPAVPGWDVVRALGGELSEVSSFSDGDDLEGGRPALVAGRFEKGGLFQMTLLPQQRPSWRLAVVGTQGRVELHFPQGWQGPAWIEWRDEEGRRQEEYYHPWDAWPELLERFEKAVEGRASPAWQDELRCLELDDAARRSVERRRVGLMEYQEASEEVGFKGTMTLAGCGMLWAVLLLLIVSRWVPWLGWLILPLLLGFVVMQLLRWVLPAKPKAPAEGEQRDEAPPGTLADVERQAAARKDNEAITAAPTERQ
jgi:predicted dehydrogenase